MKEGNFGRRLCGFAVGAALSLLFSGAAQASYIVKTAGIDASVGSLNGTVNYAPTGLSEGAAIGRLALSGTNTASGASFTWATYCVDIFDRLGTGTFTAAPISALNLSSVRLADLNALVSNVGSYVTNATTSAAAQMAVWEIVNETSSTLDVTGGAFTVTNIGSDALGDANKMLQAVTSGYWKPTDGFSLALAKSDGNQTQLVYGGNAAGMTGAVPEPASWMMMIVGFGAIGLVTRRRKASLTFA